METIEIIPDTELTPFAAWQEGLLSAEAAAAAVAHELMTLASARSAIAVIDPQERAIAQQKVARRAELGTLLIRIGAPLEVSGRVARWVEPTEAESVSVKQLKALIADLHAQGMPELDALARRIAACITRSLRAGYPLIEAAPRGGRSAP